MLSRNHHTLDRCQLGQSQAHHHQLAVAAIGQTPRVGGWRRGAARAHEQIPRTRFVQGHAYPVVTQLIVVRPMTMPTLRTHACLAMSSLCPSVIRYARSCGRWDADCLSGEQLHYAAADAVRAPDESILSWLINW